MLNDRLLCGCCCSFVCAVVVPWTTWKPSEMTLSLEVIYFAQLSLETEPCWRRELIVPCSSDSIMCNLRLRHTHIDFGRLFPTNVPILFFFDRILLRRTHDGTKCSLWSLHSDCVRLLLVLLISDNGFSNEFNLWPMLLPVETVIFNSV